MDRRAVIVVGAAVSLLAHSFPAAAGVAPSGTLGTVTATTKAAPSCPAGSTCQVVTVACPNVLQSRQATVAVASPTAARRGVVALFTGGSGSSFWGSARPAAGATVTKLRSAGFEVVQVRWHASWLAAARGEMAGSAALACRPATIIRWIHDTRYAPMALPPAVVGRCGFCVSGTSGGSSAITYALSHYGLDTLVDGIFPVSGPPHAALVKGCMRTPGEEGYWYSGSNTAIIDSSYGYLSPGPCTAHDSSFEPNWAADGVEATGTDYLYSSTRVHLLIGSKDPVMALHANEYVAVLRAHGTTVTLQTVPTMPHDLSRSQLGLDTLHALLVA